MTARKPWAHQGSRHARGLGTAWDKVRAMARKRDKGMCVACAKQGRVTPAVECDHIIPRDKGGKCDLSNAQWLCKPCHDEKTARENGRAYKPKVRIGVSGWPIED